MSITVPTFTMAALEAATQRARVRGRSESFRSLTLAGWVAGSSPAMVIFFDGDIAC